MKGFSPYRLDTVNRCLWRSTDSGDEERILLQPKPFAILLYLVGHAGRLVTQEELLEAVWPDTFVQPDVLKRHIFEIREVLGDDPKTPLFIETLPRRGYQFIAAVRDADSAEPGAETPPQAKLVGRERALGELRAYLQKMLGGQRQIVFVTGEPGIGKTTVVDEFHRRAGSSAPLRIARGQCVEGYGGKEPYYPMLEALGNLCRGPEGESVVQILAARAPTWLVQFPSLLKRQQREALQREILGATRQRMLREIGDALDMMTSEHPLLLILEDLHWADPSTVDLISALARDRQRAKLLLVGTYRPVDVALSEHPLKVVKQDLLVHQLCHELGLQPLGEMEIAAYLAGETPDAAVPRGLAALLHKHSEGNPLFMVAALEHMTHRGFISHESGTWKLNVPLEEIDGEVPESLRQMIEIQIERLSPEERRVLEVASVQSAGRSRFAVATHAPALDLELEAFEEICETLARRHSVLRSAGSVNFPDGTTSACYEFVHESYRAICHGRIPPRRRAQMHKQIGEWAEIHRWLPVNEEAAWLAGHFEQAGDWQRAVKYLRGSAETAGRRFEPRQAAGILEHALELVKKLPDPARATSEIEILDKLARIYVASADVRAIDTYGALAAAASHSGSIDVQTRALIDLAFFLSWSSSQRALEVFERALQLSDLQSPMMQARTRMSCFFWRMWVAGWNPQDAEECGNAFARIRQSGDRSALAPHLVEYSFLQWASSEYHQAHRSAIESLAILLEGDAENPYLNLEYLLVRIIVPWSLLFAGEWGGALQEIEAAITIMEKNGDTYRIPTLRLIRAWLHFQAMDFSGTQTICESVLDMRRSDTNAGRMPQARISLILGGSAEIGLGNYERGLDHLLEAAGGMDREMVIHDWYWRMVLESALTDLWLAKGDLVRSRAHAERFLEVSLATAERTWRALAWDANARVAAAELDFVRAQDCNAKAVTTMEGFDVPLAAWRVHATAARLYASSGKTDLAQHHRELSRATILKLANSLPPAEPLRATFLSATAVRDVLGDARTTKDAAITH